MPTAADQLRAALSDRYDIDREIGAGGMATVYLARDIKLDRKVALKVLKPELGAILGVERFLAEIKVTANLQHPNLLPLFDSGEAGGLLFYVMPFVEGESLRARLDRERQLPVDESVRLTGLLASALDYAHARGVIHRDLKPENILLQHGQPVIADFGIALAVANAGGSRITQTGLSLGTPHYMSPEQATGDRTIDARTDQYSLAAVAYEMLTGEPPHSGPTAQAIIARLVTERPRSIHAYRESVPQAMDDAVLRALAKLPADRFASCGEFARAMASGGAALPSAVPPHAARRPTVAARLSPYTLLAALFVAVAAVAVNVVKGRSQSTLDATRVFIAQPSVGDKDGRLSAAAALVNDVTFRGVTAFSWAKVESPAGQAGTTTSDDDAASHARRVHAATAVTTTLLPTGDSVQLQFRVIDAQAGTLLRSLPIARVAANAPAEELRKAVDPLVVTLGFITSPRLGAPTLPSADLPTSEGFRLFESALSEFGSVDTLSRNRMLQSLRVVVAQEPQFAQARLWLGFADTWYATTSRRAGGAARTDTIVRWVNEARGHATPFEAALGDFAIAGTREFNEQGLAAARRIIAISPNSPIRRALPSVLLDLNRPREALAMFEGLSRRMGDSTPAPLYLLTGEVLHFLGDYKAQLGKCRAARRLGPSDQSAIRCEVTARIGLGDTAAVRSLLDELSVASGSDRQFGFAGDAYLMAGQELGAHGFPKFGTEVVARSLTWFEANDAPVRTSMDVALRKGIALGTAGHTREAIAYFKALMPRDSSDSRVRGYLGRLYADVGDSAALAGELAWLRSLPNEKMQGAPQYEIAAITAHLGRAHWDEAVTMLEASLRQGQGFGIRRRLHFFQDWTPLKDYPPFKKVLEPRG